jgi:hypothetical protein
MQPALAGQPASIPTPQETAPGVCFVVALPQPIDLQWVVTHEHPERPELVYLVPADHGPWVGSADVVVPSTEAVPLVLRCGEGLWLERRHLPPDCCVGTIPAETLQKARRVLAQLVRGSLTGDPDQEETDWDSDYEDWLETIAGCRERWRESLEPPGTVVLYSTAPAQMESVSEATLTLAAAPGSPLLRDLDQVLQAGQPLAPRLLAASVAGEALWSTNPVLCLERALDRFTESSRPDLRFRLRDVLTRHAVIQSPAEPGVVGVGVEVPTSTALVVPLVARPDTAWSVAPTLPFTASRLQELLLGLLRAANLPGRDAVPERFAFAVESPFPLSAAGPSMDVAGLLALVRARAGEAEVLDCTCSLIEPAADGSLRATDALPLKLAAFLREYGHGSLLLLTPDADITGDDLARFDQVWRPGTWKDLARHLSDSGLLAPFLDHSPLSPTEFTLVRKRLQDLHQATQFGAALDLLQRTQAVLPETLSTPDRWELLRLEAELCRHLGQADRAERLARELGDQLSQAGDATSFEEQLAVAVEHAAAFYDWHRFAEMADLLEPWLTEVEAAPRRFQPETRVRLFNTLARARVILQRPGWEDLFRRSLDLLARRDPYDLGRTYGYLVHGLLRHQRVEQARAALDECAALPMVPLSRWWLRACEADWARQTGRLWTDPEMEAGPPPAQPGHPFAFYLQATARQKGRELVDRQQRFQRATRVLETDARQSGAGSLLPFLACCLGLAAAASGTEPATWDRAREQLVRYLEQQTGTALADHYQPIHQALISAGEPSEALVETLLLCIPYT